MRLIRRPVITLIPTIALAACASAQQRTSAAAQTDDAPSTAAITAADLRTRLGIFADDSMMGRAAGTPWNDKGTDYIARELQRLGLRPAGENGTFFQSAMVRRTLQPDASVSVDGQTFAPWRDFLPRDPRDLGADQRDLSGGAQVVYGGTWGDTATLIAPSAVAGKVVIFTVPPLANGQPGWQANRGALAQRYRNATAIAVASLDAMPAAIREQLAQSGPALRSTGGGPSVGRPQVPAFFYSTRAMAEAMLGRPLADAQRGTAGRAVRGTLNWREEAAPGRNVIAILPGRDPALRGQYVAIGSHNDHVGFSPGVTYDHDSLRAANLVVRPQGAEGSARPASEADLQRIRATLDSLRRLRPARRDSIFNGADDDGSGSMGMLEIAEALASAPARPRRSLLFVWHTGEELGLYGAQYFTDHPTVPRDSIVAQVNVDMIGRGGVHDLPGGGPGYLQLIGSRRLSTELGDLVEAVNRRRPRPFTFDYQYDAPGHPQQFYCRSDHYMYARYGIPVVFMSTGGHVDYHMVTDEPQYIDYDKLRDVTQFIHDVAVEIANRPARLVVDRPKPNPQGQCVQ
ncbi:MAG: M28 family peptidase [Gemmatimonadota bacterium]|nr:M28 family peptidase [Gemmatimonadota bacterium]